jgi:C-terminal processing protease CtpA/Prc
MQGEYVMVTNTYDQDKFKLGDRLVSINGKNIWDEINEYVDRSHDANKLLALRKALIDLVSFPLPQEIELGLMDSTGKVRNINIMADFPAGKVSQPGPGITKKLDEQTAYIDLRVFSDEDVQKMVPGLVEYETLIFDIRGGSEISEYMLGYFTDSPIDNIEYRLNIFNRPGMPTDTLIFADKISPLQGLEGKKVYFLIDERTSGTMEQIAFLVKENNLGKLVGFPTSGTIAQTNSTTLLGDYNLMLTAFKGYNSEGQPLQGIAVKPDLLSASDLRAVYMGYDNVIMMAYKDSQETRGTE